MDKTLKGTHYKYENFEIAVHKIQQKFEDIKIMWQK